MINQNVLKYETFIIVGIVMIFTIFSKLIFNFNIDSDWFWLMAAFAITVEGFINLKQQNKFKNKYKIISKKEFEEFQNFKEHNKK